MGEENDRTLWVGNLTDDITEELLYELFLQAGPLERVTLPKDKSGSGKKRGFAFICFHHDVSVPYAYNLMNGMNLCGRPLRLQYRPGSSHEGSSNSSRQSTPKTPNNHMDIPNYLNNLSDIPSFQQQQAQMLLLQQQQLMMVQQHLGRWGANINFNGRNDMFLTSPDQNPNITGSKGSNFDRGEGTSRKSHSEFNTPKLDRDFSSRSNSKNWSNQRNQRSSHQESSSSDNSDSQNYRDRENRHGDYNSRDNLRDRHGDYNSRDRRDSMRPSSRHSNYGYGTR